MTPPAGPVGLDAVIAGAVADLTGPYKHAAVGLVTNNASLSVRFEPARAALQRAGVALTRLFAPEHGLETAAREGAAVGDDTDRLTGLPVISLYGTKVAPSNADLAGLDAVLFDLPDIGARFYTYIWTLSHVMEACARQGVVLYVLDRPNPIGGDLRDVEGPLLDEARCHSFVGRWSMPIRHSLTVGELARWWRHSRDIDVDLRVVHLDQWDRSAPVDDVGWIPPSPNMPSRHTALLYPGTCLFEGLNVSEGRGTATPFRVVGAPWVDGALLAARFNDLELPGVRAAPHTFNPLAGDRRGETCRGVLLTVTAPRSLQPVRTGVALVTLLLELWPDEVAARTFVAIHDDAPGATALDKLLGLPHSLETLRSGSLTAPGAFDCPDWVDTVSDHLLY